MYVALPIDELALGEPLPVDVFDARGRLLLRKGEIIRDQRHREWLAMHAPVVRRSDFEAWTFRYTAAVDRALRANRPLQVIAAVQRPMGSEAAATAVDESRPLPEVWADVQTALTVLLHQGTEATDFLARLLALESRMLAALAAGLDGSLFVLTQMLTHRRIDYSATHACMCAVLAEQTAAQLGWTPAQQQSVRRAALTMNVGMARLHDQLARQTTAPTAEQRRQIHEHPRRGEAVLRAVGVADERWLACVRWHHERPGGTGYPDGLTEVPQEAQLLQLLDVYVARLSPRGYRPGLVAPRAARDVYLDASGVPNSMGAALLQVVGPFLPGTYVQLANGEIGVVARRGARAKTPLVYALISRDGLPKGEAPLRDTADPSLAVLRAVPADEIKVQLPLSRLLPRL